MSQSVVDRYVDDIARTFRVSRSCLNIVLQLSRLPKLMLTIVQTATAKGLVVGAFKVFKDDKTVLDGLSARSVRLQCVILELLLKFV